MTYISAIRFFFLSSILDSIKMGELGFLSIVFFEEPCWRLNIENKYSFKFWLLNFFFLFFYFVVYPVRFVV